jgi:hypothetical protein
MPGSRSHASIMAHVTTAGIEQNGRGCTCANCSGAADTKETGSCWKAPPRRGRGGSLLPGQHFGWMIQAAALTAPAGFASAHGIRMRRPKRQRGSNADGCLAGWCRQRDRGCHPEWDNPMISDWVGAWSWCGPPTCGSTHGNPAGISECPPAG